MAEPRKEILLSRAEAVALRRFRDVSGPLVKRFTKGPDMSNTDTISIIDITAYLGGGERPIAATSIRCAPSPHHDRAVDVLQAIIALSGREQDRPALRHLPVYHAGLP